MALVFSLFVGILLIAVSVSGDDDPGCGIFIGGLILMYAVGKYVEIKKNWTYENDFSEDGATGGMNSGRHGPDSGETTFCPEENNSESEASWDFGCFDCGGGDGFCF